MSEAPYPPAEPPADGDRTNQVPQPGANPRYSASASVPVPPAQPPPTPGTYGSPTSAFGQGTQYGQPAFGQGVPNPGAPNPGAPNLGAQQGQQPSHGQPGQAQPAGTQYGGGQYGADNAFGQPPAGGARAVPVPAPATQPNPPPYGQQQPYPSQTYGQPAGQQGAQPGQAYGGGQFGAAPVGQGQFGQPPAGQGSFGSAPAYGQPPAGAPTQLGQPAGPGGPGGYGGYDRPGTPQQGGQGTYGSPVYGQPQGEQGRSRDGQPPAGPGSAAWAEPGQEPPQRKSKRGLIITFISVAVLIVVGVGAFVGWSLTNQASDYAVGVCVKQSGNDAVVTECSGADVFRITSIVSSDSGCPDPNQPSLVLTERVGGSKKWACLEPVS